MGRMQSFIITCVIAAFLAGCAQVRSISGGEKDTEAPQVVSVDPAFFTRSFSESGFTLEFDEFVQLSDVQQELLISPPLKRAPKVKVRQKNVEVSWTDSLAAQTTYIFQFGKAIRDVNESNILQDFTYVFSTGNAIDSLHCEGKAVDAFTDKPASSMKILLFDSLSHVFLADKRPAYLTRSDADGHFRFDYLRSGVFTLCVLSDENNNNRYDIGESIDWKEMVNSAMPADSALHRLEVSTPRDSVFRGFNYSSDSSGVVKCRYDRWLERVSIRSQNADSVVQWTANDSLYIAPWKACSNPVELYVTCGGHAPDTVESRYTASETPIIKLRQSASSKMRITDPVQVTSKRPIALVNDDLMQCYIDSILIPARSQSITPVQREVLFDKRPGSKYKVRLLPGWITDDCGNTNDTLEFSFSTYDAKELGSLRFKLPDSVVKKNYTFHLYDKSKKLVYYAPEIASAEWVLDNLVSGEYSAVVCEDTNGNGYFDPLQITPRINTERNHYFSGNIQVRANWEVVVDWPSW
jgi:hypothetical protein